MRTRVDTRSGDMLLRRLPSLLLIACLGFAPLAALADSAAEIDARVREALQELYRTSSAAKDIGARAHGMLVFPRIFKGGIGIGGEYGEGALLTGGHTAGYYNMASASIGLQLGVQKKSVVVMFMNAESLKKFRESEGWKAGVDGSVAIATLGVGEQIDTETAQKPIIGWVFSNKGLMYNLTLEGSKISKLDKSKP